MNDRYSLVMAVYPAGQAAADTDFEALVGMIKAKQVRSEGAVLIDHDPGGRVTVRQTGDHLGRKGLGWGGGVGVVVGLFSPPLLASVVAGGAVGALLGRFTRHKEAQGFEGLGAKVPPGTSAIVTVVDEDDLAATERVLTTPARSVVAAEKSAVRGLKAELAAAAGKFHPDRTVLPIPDRNFGGAVGRTMDDAVGDWSMIAEVTPPENAPNVLICLIDDAGFGCPDTFGGPVATPTMTRVREMGVAYNGFHVTALCSPTRAALLTGRNHHRVGFGSIAEYPGPFPGYTSSRPRSCTALPRILKENGYVTAGFGKWHLTPDNVQGSAGPFDHWPKAWGFDHWWGFLSGAAGQYDPIVTQDDSTLGVPEGRDGKLYYFPDDLTDKAVEWLHGVRAQNATKPWMMYYSTGCSHAPHHVSKEWADRYKGRFDAGWDKLREETFERQKRLGVVPADCELTPRPDLLPAWDGLSDEQKELYARQMEVFAGYSENADWNIGRLLDAIEEMGDLDNTLVIFAWGDNGASLEGTLTGSFNETTFLNGLILEADEQMQLIARYGGIAELGGVHTAPHFASAWAWAGNTPFRWGKQVASHLGGTRNPLVVAWPGRLRADGVVRSQFTHVNDIAPTVLEAVGLPEPGVVDGIDQEPMDGTSFLYTFDDARAPERHGTQYFEFMGNRAIYHEGWWACARLDRKPWDVSPETLRRWGPGSGWNPDRDDWELYYLPEDFSQAHDLAGEHPQKLAELKELFWAEAERNRVLPLMSAASIFYGILPPMPTQTRFAYTGEVQNIQRGMVPHIYGHSYSIEADLDIPEGGAEGVVVANGDFTGGFALWVDDQHRLNHTYSFLGVDTFKQTSTGPLPTGKVNVKMLFVSDQTKPGSGGVVTLHANGRQIAEGKMPRTVPVAFSTYAGMDIGRDNGGVVDLAYEARAPYAFTGTVKQVVFDLRPATHEDEKALHAHAAEQAVGQGAAG